MGRSERTENDAHFEMLAIKADQTKNYTEKIVKDSQAVLVPNPGELIFALTVTFAHGNLFLLSQPLDLKHSCSIRSPWTNWALRTPASQIWNISVAI